jgi:hypothetical protein
MTLILNMFSVFTQGKSKFKLLIYRQLSDHTRRHDPLVTGSWYGSWQTIHRQTISPLWGIIAIWEPSTSTSRKHDHLNRYLGRVLILLRMRIQWKPLSRSSNSDACQAWMENVITFYIRQIMKKKPHPLVLNTWAVTWANNLFVTFDYNNTLNIFHSDEYSVTSKHWHKNLVNLNTDTSLKTDCCKGVGGKGQSSYIESCLIFGQIM